MADPLPLPFPPPLSDIHPPVAALPDPLPDPGTTADLCAALTAFFGVAAPLPVARGSLGIAAALVAWGGSGAVAVPAAVCQDVIAAIHLAGRQPLFCDIDPATGQTPAAAWVAARTQGATAAIVVHLYGTPAATEAARAVFADGLVIDDAAQALGAHTADGRLAGTGGTVGLVSFGATKQIEAGGGAALLCHDPAFARACARVLALPRFAPVPAAARAAQQARFRAGLAAARARLLVADNDTAGFVGLLDDYGPCLRPAWDPAWAPRIQAGLAAYPARLAARRARARQWQDALSPTPLQPVGLVDAPAAPWRFACRLPGLTVARQQRIGDALRARGLDVSHWYLPGSWYDPRPHPPLPGAERLAREVFQFWIDDSMTPDRLDHSAAVVRHILDQEATGGTARPPR